MKGIRRNIYMLVRKSVYAYMNLFLEFKVWGKKNIPEGPKIFCSNHFSSTDPFFVITLMDEPVHMVIGPGFAVPMMNKILEKAEQINALPEHRKDVIPNAVKYLKSGESIYIFPEGNLNDQESFLKFYNGLAKIYLEYPVPVIPIGIISPKRDVKEKESSLVVDEVVQRTLVVSSGKYFANIGKPVDLEEIIDRNDLHKTANLITERVKTEIYDLVQDIKINKFWQ